MPKIGYFIHPSDMPPPDDTVVTVLPEPVEAHLGTSLYQCIYEPSESGNWFVGQLQSVLRLGEPQSPAKFYLLKNKDRVLAEFKWVSEFGNERPALLKDHGLPKYIADYFESWVMSRRPPNYRKNISETLGALGLNTTRSILDVSMGLSLNDCLWVTSNPDVSWKAVNLFDNPFNETIAKMAFTGEGGNFRLGSPSPEFDTDGVLSKCWVREDGHIFLKKTDTGKALTLYAEVLADQLLNYLQIPHAHYSMDSYHGHMCCSSELFTSQETMMVHSSVYFDFDTVGQLMDHFMRTGLLQEYTDMLLADFLMRNQDRHPGNIGVLLDSETFELKGLAPLYDNGQSFFFEDKPALFDSWESVLQVVQTLSRRRDVDISKFDFDTSKVRGLGSEYIDTAYSVLAEAAAKLK